jgi:hypothetical protein
MWFPPPVMTIGRYFTPGTVDRSATGMSGSRYSHASYPRVNADPVRFTVTSTVTFRLDPACSDAMSPVTDQPVAVTGV